MAASKKSPKADVKPVRAEDYQPGFFDRVSELNIAMAIRHMSVMLRSGISLANSVNIMSEQSENPVLRKVFSAIYGTIQKGVSLAESMKRYPKVFSSIIISIIEVGEQGGGLDQNLLFLSDFLKKKHDLQKKINGALLYPMIVLFLTTVEMAGVIFFVLPKLETLFLTFKNIPQYTIVIMQVTRFIRLNWYYLLGVVFVIGLALYFYFKTKNGQRTMSKIMLKFPIFNQVVRLQILTSIARTIGVLMSNGIPLVRAIRITSETTTNTVYSEILAKVANEVENGTSLAQALSEYKQYFPETFLKLIELGESSGTLEENLRYLYGFYSEDLQELTSNMASLIEPLLLILIGAMIGMLAIVIVGPIYSLTSAIN
ncbi:MAG: type II secretion system F family protein [Candidatus Dojkabacteria bacterium]|nr:MAG: type II secretion system F family protein [Candidatus Dojkabacteria bacterium]